MFYGVENKGNMIAGVVGYDSIRKHLADCVVITQWKLERNAIHMDVYIEN